jgi:hypothetical protein
MACHNGACKFSYQAAFLASNQAASEAGYQERQYSEET